MVSKHQTDKIRRHLYAPERIKTEDQQIYCIVDLITDAINEGKRIRFRYFDYNGEKEKYLCNGGELYSVSPYALVWNDNHYYMVGLSDDRQEITNYRVDRMCGTGVTEEAATSLPEEFIIEEYIQQQFNMHGTNIIDVTLECADDMMDQVIDQFGEDVETWRISEKTFYARVSVPVNPEFYGWLFQFGGKIQVTEPEEIREKYRSMVKAGARAVRKKRKKKGE